MTHMRVSDAARLLGVSDDTVRRWLADGRLISAPQGPGPQAVDAASVAMLMVEQAPAGTPSTTSARNRLPGIVTRVEKDGVMALVEIQAGPHRVTSLLSRESADELGLAVGVRAAAVVKSTNVIVEIEEER
jgi:molybdopterin-binding protein